MAGEYLAEVPKFVQRAHEALAQAAVEKCPQKILVRQRDWCVGARACHARCMLQQWHRETGDAFFGQRAEHCAGRCVAWDRVVGCQGADVECWHGHWFTSSPEVDRRWLGYHAAHCPLRNSRNIDEPSQRFTCNAPVFARGHERLASLQESLAKILAALSSSRPTPSDLLRMSLRVESIINVLTHDELGVVCEGFHHVNPWGITPRSYACHRKHAVWQVAEALHSACADLQDAFQLLSAAHVLGNLFVNKSFHKACSSRTLAAGWVLIPYDPPVEAEQEQESQPVVIQSLGWI